MSYTKLDMRTELRRLASGKVTHAPAEFLAVWALEQVTPAQPVRGDEVAFLERLFMLPDPRAH